MTRYYYETVLHLETSYINFPVEYHRKSFLQYLMRQLKFYSALDINFYRRIVTQPIRYTPPKIRDIKIQEI